MAYGDFQELTRRKASDKILHDKILHDMTDISVDLLQRFIRFLIKKLLLCAKINLLVKQLKMKLYLIKN